MVDDVVLENYWERDKPAYSVGPIELQAEPADLLAVSRRDAHRDPTVAVQVVASLAERGGERYVG